MAFYEYVVLDSKRYATPVAEWKPIVDKSATFRITIGGDVDITYGPGNITGWEGKLRAYVTPRDSNWGTPSDLRTSLAKQQGLSFTDHYGNSYTVHAFGRFEENHMLPDWDSGQNKVDIMVRLIAE